MYSWGSNINGDLGYGTVDSSTTAYTTPAAITLLTGVDSINADGSAKHFIASKPDGSVYCWGRGSNGQIGDGTNTADQGTPKQVLAGTGPSLGGKFNLFTSPSLVFDNYNKFSINHGLTSVSSKLFLGSNVYDIGALTSITIKTPGVYKSLTYDTTSNVAYFNKTNVSSVSIPPDTYGTFVQSWGENYWTTTSDIGGSTESMSFGGWVEMNSGARIFSINDDSTPLDETSSGDKDWHFVIENYSHSNHIFTMRNRGDSDVIRFQASSSGEEAFPLVQKFDGSLAHFVVTTEYTDGAWLVSLYTNGQFIAKKGWSNTGSHSIFNVRNFRIGKHLYSDSGRGSFSRMFFYNGTLTASDVNKIYHDYIPTKTGDCT